MTARYDKKKYTWKLLYAYMLGYEVDFGHIEAVNLCSGSQWSEKLAGYLACSVLLQDNHEILRLMINAIRKDISDPHNEPTAALALNMIANIGSVEFVEALLDDICRLASVGISPFLRKKALICVLRLFRKDPETVGGGSNNSVWIERFQQLLQERDVGVLLSGLGLFLGMVEACEDTGPWAKLIDPIVKLLQDVVLGFNNDQLVQKQHIYYTIKCPWLQVS